MTALTTKSNSSPTSISNVANSSSKFNANPSAQEPKDPHFLPISPSTGSPSAITTASFTSTPFSSSLVDNDSNLNETQLYHAYTLLLGHIATVRTLSGDIFEGVLHTIVPKQGAIVLKATIQNNKSKATEGNWKLNSPGTTLILPLSQLVTLHIKNVGIDQERPTKKGFQTDKSISGAQSIKERTLEKWVPDEQTFGVGASLELDPAGDSTWNQFEVNQEKFGITSNYQEELYTTKLDRESDLYKLREKEAIRLAKEIEQGTTTNPHLLEERNQDGAPGMDEEDRYGAVLRTQKPAKHPKYDHRKDHSSSSEGFMSKHLTPSSTPNAQQPAYNSAPTSSSSSSSAFNQAFTAPNPPTFFSKSTSHSSSKSTAHPSTTSKSSNSTTISSQSAFDSNHVPMNQSNASYSHGQLPHIPPLSQGNLQPQVHPFYHPSMHPGILPTCFPVQTPKPILLMATEEYRQMLILKRHQKEKESPNHTEHFSPKSFAKEVAKMPNFMMLPKHLMFSQYRPETLDKRSFGDYFSKEKLRMGAADTKENMKLKAIECLKEFHRQFKLPTKQGLRGKETGVVKPWMASKPQYSTDNEGEPVPNQISGSHRKTNANVPSASHPVPPEEQLLPYLSHAHEKAARVERKAPYTNMKDSLPSKKDYHTSYNNPTPSFSSNMPSNVQLNTAAPFYSNREKKNNVSPTGELPISPTAPAASTTSSRPNSSPPRPLSSTASSYTDASPTKRCPPNATNSLAFPRHALSADVLPNVTASAHGALTNNGMPRTIRDKKNIKHVHSTPHSIPSTTSALSSSSASIHPAMTPVSSVSTPAPASFVSTGPTTAMASNAFHLNVDAPVFVPSGPPLPTSTVETKKITSGFFAGKQLNMDNISIKAQFRPPQNTSNINAKDWLMGQPGKSYKAIAHVYPPPPPPNPYQIHPMYYYNRPPNSQPPPPPPPPTYFPVPVYPPTSMVPGPYPVTTPIMNYDARQPPNYYPNPSTLLMPPPPPFVPSGMYIPSIPPPPPPPLHPGLPSPTANPTLAGNSHAGSIPNTSNPPPSHEN